MKININLYFYIVISTTTFSPASMILPWPVSSFCILSNPTQPDLPGPGGCLTRGGLPTLESLTYPGVAVNPPMCILLLGARAPSSTVGGYFSRFPGPNCTIKFLPTPESFRVRNFTKSTGRPYLPWSPRLRAHPNHPRLGGA
jgi:hypothetical protein